MSQQILKLYFTSFFKGIWTTPHSSKAPKLLRFHRERRTIHHSVFFKHNASANYLTHPPRSPQNPSSSTNSCILNFNSSGDINKSSLTSQSTELKHFFPPRETRWWNVLWFSVHFTASHQFRTPVLHIAFRKENLISAIWYRISCTLERKYCLSVRNYWINEEEERQSNDGSVIRTQTHEARAGGNIYI